MARHPKRRSAAPALPAPSRRPTAAHLLAHPATQIAVVLLLGMLAYANTLHVPFVFDDEPNIVNNPLLRPGTHLAFSQLRYVGLLTFAANYAWGGLDVVGYHLVNLFIHLANAVLVYAWVSTTLRAPALAAAGESVSPPPASAWLCALLFVCHPIETQAVTYTVQRFASLATLFYLLTLLLYARARLAQTPVRRALWFLSALLAALLAVKTKEIAFTLPATLLLYELVCFRGKHRRLLAVVPFAAIALLIPLALLKHAGGGQPVSVDAAVHAGASAAIPRYAYLLTQTRVVVTYLRLLCLPVGLNLDYDFPVSRSLTEPAVLLSSLLLASLLGGGLWALLRARGRSDAAGARLRLVGFGTLWFFLTLSIESSVIPLADVIFEHRLYLPSVGAFLVAACAGAGLAAKLSPSRARMVKLAVAAVVLVLAGATHARNSVWRDEGGLWMDVLAKSPNNARAHNNAGNLFFAPRGRLDEAIAHFQTALRLRPGFAEAHTNLGIAYERQGRLDEAAREYETAIALSPHQASAHNNLGGIYLRRGRADDAVRELLAYLGVAPQADDGYFNLALAYETLGRREDAIVALVHGLALNPRDASRHVELAALYLAQGRTADAIPHLQTAVALRPDDGVAREALAKVMRGGR